jgi:hypothetical protein
MLHFIKFQLFIYCICFHFTCLAQTSIELKYNEGGAPKAHFFLLQGDSLIPLVHLHRAEVNVVVIRVEGGMDYVLYNQVLSSRDAIIDKSKEERNVYYITPLKEEHCELVVDVRLMENYYHVEIIKQGKRNVKKIIKEYTPRTYMIGYERFKVVD